MAQKAWAGGYTALVAVSAPSALAVTTARRAGLTLVGFARGTTATFYSPAELVDGR
jgi:FdhD protein